MAFKHDSDPNHVNQYRNIVKIAKDLDQDIDTNQKTPYEAFEELYQVVEDNNPPVPPKDVAMKIAEEKKVLAAEKEAENKAAEEKAAAEKKFDEEQKHAAEKEKTAKAKAEDEKKLAEKKAHAHA